MPVTYKFILFQILIIGPFILGMYWKRYFQSPEQLARRIVLLNLCTLDPVIILWTVWGLEISKNLILLPFCGFCMVFIGFVIGFLFSIPLHLPRTSRATFIITASLANHGFTLGGFVCYLLLGEKGLALAYIFLTYFVFYLFMFIFPYARWEQTANTAISKTKLLVETLFNIRNIPLYVTLLALILQKCHIQRFDFKMPIDTMLLISISIYYFSLGLTYSLSNPFKNISIHGVQALIKFILMPIFTLALIHVLPLEPIMESVIRIQSFMPVAILSVVVSILFDLNTRMSADLFVWNTIFFLVVVFPILYFFPVITGFI